MARTSKHQKASDVFSQTDYFLGEKTSDFSKAFPTIEKVSAIIIERGKGINEFNREIHCDERSLSEYINCHNPRCYNGGVHIGQILHFMEASTKTEDQIHKRCQGYEGSPKGRIRREPCFNTFQITINIVYKSKPSDL